MNKLVTLGFESSCDDSSVALVNSGGFVYKCITENQNSIHNLYGGVIPELAAREHLQVFRKITDNVLNFLNTNNLQVDKVAVARAPGLLGPLMVGSTFAAGIASGLDVPLVGVNHLRAHIASVFLYDQIKQEQLLKNANWPATVLLVSGGHTMLVNVNQGLAVEVLAQTSDDSAGECFDKSAKILGLGYPGGPEIERQAQKATKLDLAKGIFKKLPSPVSSQGFSFSGLKTAIRYYYEKNPSTPVPEFCWAIQESIANSLINILTKLYKQGLIQRQIYFCGGVAANSRIRELLNTWGAKRDVHPFFPSLKYCTDNAAMIALCANIQDTKYIVTETNSRDKL